jgi:hypothetical protein
MRAAAPVFIGYIVEGEDFLSISRFQLFASVRAFDYCNKIRQMRPSAQGSI